MYRFRVWAAPATPAKAPISQELSAIPSPFAQAIFEEQLKKRVKKEVQVKKEMQCYRCDYPIKKNACGAQQPVTCDICHAVYHMSCAKLRFPPKHGSWVLLCHRNDWLPIDHLYVPKCSMVVGSLLEALRKKAHFGFVQLQVVFTNVFCICLLCKGVHGECARLCANILGSYTTDICGYSRA